MENEQEWFIRMKHKHHIIPRHMGGTDEPSNLTPPISVALHAALHKDLWEHFGKRMRIAQNKRRALEKEVIGVAS